MNVLSSPRDSQSPSQAITLPIPILKKAPKSPLPIQFFQSQAVHSTPCIPSLNGKKIEVVDRQLRGLLANEKACENYVADMIKGKNLAIAGEFCHEIPVGLDNHVHADGEFWPEECITYAKKHKLLFDSKNGFFYSQQELDNPSLLKERIKEDHEIASSETELVKLANEVKKNVLPLKKWENDAALQSRYKFRFKKESGFFKCCRFIENVRRHVPPAEQIVLVAKQALQCKVSKEVMIDFDYIKQKPLPEEYEKEFDDSWEDLKTLSETKINEYVHRAYNVLSTWVDGYVKYYTDVLDESLKAIKHDADLRALQKEGFSISFDRPELKFFGDPKHVYLKFLIQVMRTQEPKAFLAEIIAACSLQSKNARVVGLNIVGPEDNTIAMAGFDAQISLMKAVFKKQKKTNLSFHVCEYSNEDHPYAYMGRVGKVLDELQGNIKRLGHVLSINKESLLLRQKLIDQQIAIEVCLSSNHKLSGIEPKDHPIKCHENGIFMFCADDEGITCSSKRGELVKALMDLKIDYLTLKCTLRNEIQYSFLDDGGIGGIWVDPGTYTELKPEYESFFSKSELTEEMKQFISKSEKAFRQLELEKKLIIFEEKIALKEAPETKSPPVSVFHSLLGKYGSPLKKTPLPLSGGPSLSHSSSQSSSDEIVISKSSRKNSSDDSMEGPNS